MIDDYNEIVIGFLSLALMLPVAHTPLYPRYHIPLAVSARLVFSWIAGKKRSFRIDAVRVMRGMTPQPIISGIEHLPADGGCVLVVNHYKRPGFLTEWVPLTLSAAVQSEITWIMTAAWTYTGQFKGIVLRPVMRLVLGAIAKTYGFIKLPPNPPKPVDAGERAVSVRKIFQAVKTDPNLMLGLAPEGLDYPENTLGLPPPGAGRMVYYLEQMGMKIVPVGAFEEDGFLKLQFGKPITLRVEEMWDKPTLDLEVRRQVMQGILSQLPDRFLFDEIACRL